jgi:soluble cytochrome b562
MKLRSFLLAASLFSLLPLIHAQQPPDQPDSPLEGQMKILARGTKQLSLQVGDPAKQQQTLTLLETLKKAASDAKTLDPRKTASLPQGDKEKFLADYRAQMDKLSDAFNQIEESVKGGNYPQAQALFASLQAIKKEGHKQFKQD